MESRGLYSVYLSLAALAIMVPLPTFQIPLRPNALKATGVFVVFWRVDALSRQNEFRANLT